MNGTLSKTDSAYWKLDCVSFCHSINLCVVSRLSSLSLGCHSHIVLGRTRQEDHSKRVGEVPKMTGHTACPIIENGRHVFY